MKSLLALALLFSVSAHAAGTFTVSGGKILAPNGSAFVAKGINVLDNEMGTVSTGASVTPLLTLFPGLNFVRLAAENAGAGNFTADNVAALTNFVNQLTAKGIVVEIEDHDTYNSIYTAAGRYSQGGNGTSGFTSSVTLGQVTAWYSSLATAFLNNPYVWFGDINEPGGMNYPTAGDTPSPKASGSAQTLAIYNAIRATGNNTIFLLQPYAGGESPSGNSSAWPYGTSYTDPNYIGTLIAADYAKMTNVAWDMHFYQGDGGTSTNQATINGAFASYVALLQTGSGITSANGTIPVMIAEFGNSQSGNTGGSGDSNGTQIVAAVLGSGDGFAAWLWNWPGIGGIADNLVTQANNALTSYGQQVATAIGTTPPVVTPPTPPVTAGGATWDPANQTGSILSNGNLTLTTNAGTTNANSFNGSGARVTPGYMFGSANKVFLSVTMVQGTANAEIGIVPSVYSLGGGPIGGESWENLFCAGLGYQPYYSSGGGLIEDSDYSGTGGGSQYAILSTAVSPTWGSTMIIAADFSRGVGYIYTPEGATNGVPWNLKAGDNPVTNTGGAPFSSHFAGDMMYVYAGAGEAGSVWTINQNPTDAVSKSLLAAGWSLWGGTAPVTPPPAITPSPNNTVVLNGSAGTIIDKTGNKWTVVGGVVMQNGLAAGFSANVTEIAYVSSVVWQEAGGLWWPWSGSAWTGNGVASPLPVTPPPPPPGPASCAAGSVSLGTLTVVSGVVTHC